MTVFYIFSAAVDGDLPKEILRYKIQNCWWGTVSLEANVSHHLNSFTQEQIDKGMVIFRHQSKQLSLFLIALII